jgi:hypothetical protein
VDGGVLVRLKDEQKTELTVARDRVRELGTPRNLVRRRSAAGSTIGYHSSS